MRPRQWWLFVAMLFVLGSNRAWGQTFGVEAQNVLMPASGGMAGTSIARPQDLTSALNANPASLSQFAGRQFTFSGAWAEPTFNLQQTTSLPLVGVTPFAAKSAAQGGAFGNIGATYQLNVLGRPATFGVGFITAGGGNVDFRNIPASNGTTAALTVFEITTGMGMAITDRLSIGAGMSLGTAFFNGPFVGIGAMTTDYALRGVTGLNYRVAPATTLGFYYQTQQSFRFDDAILFTQGPINIAQDINMDLPENFGWGIANNRLMDGRLLLAADIVYKLWENADLYRAIYRNQFVFQTGAQYTLGRCRLRAGYAYAQDPMNPTPLNNPGGIIPPGGPASVRYTQALLAVPNPHRISAGFGITDFLPGLDLDFMAGGMFRDTAQLGPSTSVSVASYWVGTGLTWRCGARCPASRGGR